ncbi:MAG: hypothetical protein K9N21_09590 [Deltaproteobacteria bacterium]|nr:hypothetical protein [Deltaproteobacteria bacterium]
MNSYISEEALSFGNLVAGRVRFGLIRYFTRKAQVADFSSFVILAPLGDEKRIFLKKSSCAVTVYDNRPC